MNSDFQRRCGSILLTILLYYNTSAQKPPEINNLEKKIKTEKSWVLNEGMRLHAATGIPLAIYRANFVVRKSSPESMARQYLMANLELLGMEPQDLQTLRLHAIRESTAGVTIRMRQFYQNIPVEGGEITVTIDHDHMVSLVMNAFCYHIKLPNVVAKKAPSQARDVVLNHLKVRGRIIEERSELVIFEHLDQAKLYYKINLVTEEPLGEWESLVDAATGELFKIEDKACYDHNEPVGMNPPSDFEWSFSAVNGTGNVFDPDPLSSAHETYGATGFSDGGDTNTTQLNDELKLKTLRDINFDGTNYSLIGPWAEIQDFESPLNGLYVQDSAIWNFSRSEDGFEAVNVYYHIDGYMRYLNDTLELDISPYQYTGGVRFDPHGLNGVDNSHYLSGSGRLSFGEGGVDDAEDSDVIHHELGHGLHDWVTSGGLSQTDGLSEGSGDYCAASYNRSLGNWSVGEAAYDWVFNWDGHNAFWPGRVVNYSASYPSGLVGQIHTDGQIWSTAMMKVWDAIGHSKSDIAFWNGLGMTNGSSNQNDAANAVYQAAITMNYTHAELSQIHQIFTVTGYMLPGLPPINDHCSGAILLLHGGSQGTFGSSEHATPSIVGCIGDADDDVWYKFVAADTTAIIKVTGNGDYDAVIEFYTECDSLVQTSCTNMSGEGAMETYIASDLILDSAYYYRVYDWKSTSPTNWTFATSVALPPPENDECENASPMVINLDTMCSQVATGTLAGATGSMLQDSLCTSEEADDVWFSFTALTNVHEIFISNVIGNSSQLLWSLWSGSCDSLVLVLCAGDALNSSLILMPDSTYYIRFYTSGVDHESATFDVCISSYQDAPFPCNQDTITIIDQFVPNDIYHAIQLMGTNQTVLIPTNGLVDFKAGIAVELNPNFGVEEGAVFTADILPCDPPISSHKNSTEHKGQRTDLEILSARPKKNGKE